MVLVCYIYYFKYLLLDTIMTLLTFLHKRRTFSVLVSIYMCTDCQHAEIIQTKHLTIDLPIYVLSFFSVLNLLHDLYLQNTFSFFTYFSFILNS